MTSLRSATILTQPRPPATKLVPAKTLGGAALALLLWLSVGVLPAAAPAETDLGSELARLARALREHPSLENYQRLARFADKYKESEVSAQAEFALGVADYEAHRTGQARERFRAAQASAPLAEQVAFYLARTESELGQFRAAESILRETRFAGGALEETAQVFGADLLVRTGRAGQALEWLQEQPGVWQRPALLLALGRAQWSAGQEIAAAETLERVYYEFPLSAEAEPSNELLAGLRAKLNARFPSPSEALRRTRAEKLWAAGAYNGARSAYLDLSVRSNEPTRTEARLRAALALSLLGYGNAACTELAGMTMVPAMEAEFHSLRARCRLRGGDHADAEADLAVLRERYSATEAYAQALLAVGDTAMTRGENARARDAYRRLLEAFPQIASAPEAHWKLAWLTYRSKDHSSAAQLFEEHLERFPDSPFFPRALYWRAHLALNAGEESLGQFLLQRLREVSPREYLAQQAEARRGRRRRPGAAAGDDAGLPAWAGKLARVIRRPANLPDAGAELPPAIRAQLETAAALERLSLWELAGETLAWTVRRFPHPEITLAQARLAFVQEKYARATETLHRAYPAYWRAPLDELPREVWEMMFPRPYWEVIEREARGQGIDPYLVAALIRQESRFEREAVSSAGALGLMQLMPLTARRVAGRRLSQNVILQPEMNIRVGTRYLARLLRQFDGSLEKAVAGYNAGESRVKEWNAQASYREPAEFVESIPITQTREFVHTVLRNYRFYRDLYERPARLRAGSENQPASDPR